MKPFKFAWLVFALLTAGSTTVGETLYIAQSNDVDPTEPTSQVGQRWYHWIGVDPVVTHLETGLAVDSTEFAGMGQRFDLSTGAPISAIQVKIKRIGNPGPLSWEAGTAWGRNDLGSGKVPAEAAGVHYERFVTFPIKPAAVQRLFLRLSADSGRSPDDYYAVYCTWAEAPEELTTLRTYTGEHRIGMMYRMIRPDAHGAALDADGRPVGQGASMMARLLTAEEGPGRRPLLPDEEEPYRFVDDLAAGVDPRWAGLPCPDAKPQDGEIVLGEGWKICVSAPRSPQVETAVADLEAFLRRQMGVKIPVVWEMPGKESNRHAPRAVADGTGCDCENRADGARSVPATLILAQGPDLPGGPRRPAGYRFTAAKDEIRIEGFDGPGVLRGVWYLEDLLTLRGGPFLRGEARTREPRYRPRATCTAWGGIGEMATPTPVYTDAHLSLISHYGYDAIWVNWCPGPEPVGQLPTRIAPGRTPDGTSYQPFQDRLRDLTERAERYDVQVVLLYAAPHPASPPQLDVLREQARQLLRDVPKIRTIVFLDEGMGSTKAGLDAWVATCSHLAEAMREVKPDVSVTAWTYTFAGNAGIPGEPRWNQYAEKLLRLDRRIGLMANFDSFYAERRDGLRQRAFDYCLSLKAPSIDYARAAEALLAESRDGQAPRRLWAKIETRFSQESNTQPEIPCMQRWINRYQAVNQFGPPPIAGIVGNWYHQGFYPTPVTELFAWFSYTGEPEPEELLRAIARRDFGPGQEDLVVSAWNDFSEAIWHYPFYYGLSYTMNAGYAQPFWLDPDANNPRPWRRGFVNSLKTMQMEASGEGERLGEQNRQRLAELHRYWSAGLEKLRKAVDAAPARVREVAQSHWQTARSFGNNAEVTLRLVRWLDARDRWYGAKSADEKKSATAELDRIGREELAAAEAALPMYRRDSRLGHLNHGRGCFTALTIEKKIDMLRQTLAQLTE